jgi:hypothetical protein
MRFLAQSRTLERVFGDVHGFFGVSVRPRRTGDIPESSLPVIGTVKGGFEVFVDDIVPEKKKKQPS